MEGEAVAYGIDSNENGWVDKMGSLTAGQNSGGTQQVVAYSIREDAKADNFSATEIETARALQSLQPSVQSHHAQTFIAETPLAYDDPNGGVAATLRSGGDGGIPSSRGEHLAIQSPAVVRRLTPTECERLQGFPDGWTDDQADSNRYKQMGNAVTVNVIRWIGERL